MNFSSPIEFQLDEVINGSSVFKLTDSLRYSNGLVDIIVPKGFKTDGASVPRLFWNIFNPFGEYFPAAIIHDWLYSKQSNHLFFSREDADEIFHDAMDDIGVNWLTRMTIYSSVRLFGWKFYKGK